VGGKLAVTSNSLSLDRLRAVDGSCQFRTAEGDDGQPAEDDQSGESYEGFHVRMR